MDNQQPSFHIINNTKLIWEKVQRLFRKEVHIQAIGMWKWYTPIMVKI